MKFILLCEWLKRTEGKHGFPYVGRIRNNLAHYLENYYIKFVKIPEHPLDNSIREKSVIVSLTTIPERIGIVYYAIKSLMLQTYPPNRIILWLAKEQFAEMELPKKLLFLQNTGLEIQFCNDIKPHKKYYFAMQEQGNDLLLTYDDDLIYPPDSIEKLICWHEKYPDCIICNRAQILSLTNDGKLKSCTEWKVYSKEGWQYPSDKIMASTGGGCLYPPHCFGQRVFNLSDIKKCALRTDDLWMKTMALYYNVQIVKTTKEQKPFTVITHSQEVSLTALNDILKKNDESAIQLQKYFPEAFLKLK